MNIPPEIFEKDLTDPEFRVLSSLYHVANGRGIANLTLEELGDITRKSRETLRRSIRSLEEHGFIETIRKKRNYGKYHRNVYQLTIVPEYQSPCPNNEASTESVQEESPCLNNEASTDSYIANKLTSTNSVVNTSYLLQVRTSAHEGKEIKVGRWSLDEDDNLGSVGLFEEELLEKVTPKKVSKSDPRTRNQRPDYEWTGFDVAAEFGDKLRRHFPEMPRLINTRNLGMVLTKYRKELNTNALVELELVKIFFADEKNLSYVARNPDKAMGVFLNLFKSRLADAMERLSMSAPQRSHVPQVDSETQFLYASDGTRFENNLVGRKALQLHEERLARNV